MKYYHRIPNSLIRCMVSRDGANLCEDVAFTGHLCDTDQIEDDTLRASAEKYLAGIANRPGSNVSTKSHEDIEADVQAQRIADVRAAAEAAQTKLIQGGERP